MMTTSIWLQKPGTQPAKTAAGTLASPARTAHPVTRSVTSGCHWKPPPALQFNNVDAKLYGFDMDWALQLNDRWAVSGIVNYVRGERDDTDDNLYRIAPPNATFRLNYAQADWSAAVEGVIYDKQNQVSETNAEQKASGYGIVKLSGTWPATSALQLAAGVDNVFDREYQDHLNGYNRAANPDISTGTRLPGYGVNAFARLLYDF
tara:strand:+ start:43625 stop:44239 length:615 start_codon:yes stop_codon:yes gene_type:complete